MGSNPTNSMMSICPSCGDSFDTSRSMKIHHKQAHGESIAREKTSCQACGADFEYYPSSKPGNYCEECVADDKYQDISGLEDNWGRSGEDNPNYNGGEYKGCNWCDSNVYVSPYEIENHDKHFCSKECYNMWMSENYQGKDNPYWKGGYNPNYSDGWWKARRKTLKRDNHECQICGATESPDGRTPDVHHKKPVREFDNPSNAHYLKNLVTLCRTCHSKVENENQKI